MSENAYLTQVELKQKERHALLDHYTVDQIAEEIRQMKNRERDL